MLTTCADDEDLGFSINSQIACRRRPQHNCKFITKLFHKLLQTFANGSTSWSTFDATFKSFEHLCLFWIMKMVSINQYIHTLNIFCAKFASDPFDVCLWFSFRWLINDICDSFAFVSLSSGLLLYVAPIEVLSDSSGKLLNRKAAWLIERRAWNGRPRINGTKLLLLCWRT